MAWTLTRRQFLAGLTLLVAAPKKKRKRVTTLNYTFEGGADEVTITTSDTGSGDAFDGVNIPAQGGSPAVAEVKYDDDALVADGVMGCRIRSTDAGSAFLLWDASIGSATESYVRCYFRRPTSLPGDRQIIQIRSSAPAHIFSARLNSSGNVKLHDAAGTARYTSSKAFASAEDFRLEIHVSHNATNGHMEGELYYGANIHGTTPDESFGSSTDNWNTGAAIDHLRVGHVTVAGAGTNETIFLDELAFSTVDWIGPAAGGGGAPGTIPDLVEPDTSTWTIIRDPNPAAAWTPTLLAGVNYRLLPPVGVTNWVRSRLIDIQGGRHVEVRDLTIDIGVSGSPMIRIAGGPAERDVWFIDVTLKDTGKFQSDHYKTSNNGGFAAGGNIATGSGGTNVYQLRCRSTGIVGELNGVHADGWQFSGGIKSLHMQDCTWSSGWVGGQYQRELFQGSNPTRSHIAVTKSGTIGTIEIQTGADLHVGDWWEMGDTIVPNNWRSAYPVRSILTGTPPNVTRFTVFLGDGAQSTPVTTLGAGYKSAFIYYVGPLFLKNVNFRAQSNAPITDPTQTVTAFRIPAGRPDFKGSNAEDRTPALVEAMVGLTLDNVWVESNASPPDDSLDELLEPSTNSNVYTPARGVYDLVPTPNEYSWPNHPAISGLVFEGVPPGGDFAPASGTATTVTGAVRGAIPAFTGTFSAVGVVTGSLAGFIPAFDGTFSGNVTGPAADAEIFGAPRPKELSALAFTIDGQPVTVTGVSLNDNAGGYDQLRGAVAAQDWVQLVADQGSEVVAYSEGEPVWAGRLSTRPLVGSDGLVEIAAQGHKHAARKYEKPLFIQARGLEGWTATDTEPHLNAAGENVYPNSPKIAVDLDGSRARFAIDRDVALPAPHANGIVFYREGVDLARLAWRANYLADAESSNRKFQPYQANGPTGTETQIGAGRGTTASNNGVDREETFTPTDLVGIQFEVVTDHTPVERRVFRLNRLRVNSTITLADEFEGAEVIRYIAGVLGYDPAGITSGVYNILPFDWGTGDWLGAALYVADLEDRYFRVGSGEQPLAEYASWGTRRWIVAQGAGVHAELNPLERYDAVRVWYTAVSGVKRSAFLTSDEYPALGNTFEFELADVQDAADLASAVAARLLPYVSTQTYEGTVDVPVATSSDGLEDVRRIRYGDELVISDFAPNQALASRVLEVSQGNGVPSVTVGRPVNPQAISDRILQRRRNR